MKEKNIILTARIMSMIFHHTLMKAQIICIASATTTMMLMTRGVLRYSIQKKQPK